MNVPIFFVRDEEGQYIRAEVLLIVLHVTGCSCRAYDTTIKICVIAVCQCFRDVAIVTDTTYITCSIDIIATSGTVVLDTVERVTCYLFNIGACHHERVPVRSVPTISVIM